MLLPLCFYVFFYPVSLPVSFSWSAICLPQWSQPPDSRALDTSPPFESGLIAQLCLVSNCSDGGNWTGPGLAQKTAWQLRLMCSGAPESPFKESGLPCSTEHTAWLCGDAETPRPLGERKARLKPVSSQGGSWIQPQEGLPERPTEELPSWSQPWLEKD